MLDEITLKIILLGDSDTEKPIFLERYIDKNKNSNNYPTIGRDFGCKVIKMKDKTIRLQIWDTPGKERINNLF